MEDFTFDVITSLFVEVFFGVGCLWVVFYALTFYFITPRYDHNVKHPPVNPEILEKIACDFVR